MSRAKIGSDVPFIGYMVQWGCSVSNIIEFAGGKVIQSNDGNLLFKGKEDMETIEIGDYILKNTVADEVELIRTF